MTDVRIINALFPCPSPFDISKLMKDLFGYIHPVTLYFCVVYPGIISILVYRLLTPCKIEWSSITFQGIFFGTFVFFCVNPIITELQHITNETLRFVASFSLITGVATIIPICFYKLRKWRFINRFIIEPSSSAWDYIFSKRQQFFIKIHLINGDIIAGYFGNNSCASSKITGGDIYLNWAYEIDSDGNITSYINNSCGLYVKNESILYMEFFHKEDNQDA